MLEEGPAAVSLTAVRIPYSGPSAATVTATCVLAGTRLPLALRLSALRRLDSRWWLPLRLSVPRGRGKGCAQVQQRPIIVPVPRTRLVMTDPIQAP